MATKLTDIDVEEVSFVDKGANKGAKILLFKAGEPPTLETVVTKYAEQMIIGKAVSFDDALATLEAFEEVREIEQEFNRMFEALHRSINSVIADPEISAKRKQIEGRVKQFLDEVKQRAKVAKAADNDLTRSDAGNTNREDTHMTPQELEKKFGDQETKITELTKRAEAAEQKLVTAEAEVKKAKETANTDPDAELKKKLAALPEDVRKQFEDVRKDNTDLRKRVDAAEDAVQIAEFTKRAAAEISTLPGTVEAKARVLRLVSKFEEADQKAAFEMLKAGEQHAKLVLAEKGATGTVEGSAYTELEKKAREIAKAENVTFEKGLDLATERHPELYRQYKAETV